MRILFAGSPAIAAPTLELLARTRNVVGVLTNPDSARGRGKRVEPTEVAAAAERINLERLERGLSPIPVLKPDRLGAEARELVAPLSPDLLVVVAYGRIFGPKFLALFPKGGVNLHPSLLPRYRGCAPIPAAILNRDAETGISIQRLALEMDAGDLLSVERLALDGTETTETLSAVAAERGARLAASVLDAIEAGTERPVPQDHAAATYCQMLRKEDGRLDWTASASVLDARIRAFSPWPGAFTVHGSLVLNVLEARPYPGSAPSSGSAPECGTVLGVDKAAGILVQTGDGLLALRRLQYETKKPLDWRSFLNGARDLIGSRLGAGSPSR
jgi:methionyl-tRNA formyltransferase